MEGVGQAGEGLVCAPLGGRREPLLSHGRLASQMGLLGAGRPVWSRSGGPVSAEGSPLLPVEDPNPSSPQMGLYALAQPQEGEAMFPALSGLLSGLTRPSGRQRSQVLAQLKYDVQGRLAPDTVTRAWLQTWPFGCHHVTLGRSGNLSKLQHGEGPLPFFLSTSLYGGSVTWTEGLLPDAVGHSPAQSLEVLPVLSLHITHPHQEYLGRLGQCLCCPPDHPFPALST